MRILIGLAVLGLTACGSDSPAPAAKIVVLPPVVVKAPEAKKEEPKEVEALKPIMNAPVAKKIADEVKKHVVKSDNKKDDHKDGKGEGK